MADLLLTRLQEAVNGYWHGNVDPTALAYAVQALIDQGRQQRKEEDIFAHYLRTLQKLAVTQTSEAKLNVLGYYTVSIYGTVFPSVMHAFQALKVFYQQPPLPVNDCVAKIKTFADVSLAKVLQMGCDKHAILLDVDTWRMERTEIMRNLVALCVGQNPCLLANLLYTSGNIEEDILEDAYWSIHGQNQLGRIWEEVRTYFTTRLSHA